MYLRCFVGTVWFATRMVALLSTFNGVAVSGLCPISQKRRRSHNDCYAAADAARYSASHVDIATVFCLDDCYMTGLVVST